MDEEEARQPWEKETSFKLIDYVYEYFLNISAVSKSSGFLFSRRQSVVVIFLISDVGKKVGKEGEGK